MSGKDETDLVRNKEFLAAEQIASAQPIKSNVDAMHDHTNGDTKPMNGENSIGLDDKSKQTNVTTTTTTTTATAVKATPAPTNTMTEPTTPKTSTQSNWVQFDNEDGSDKVRI